MNWRDIAFCRPATESTAARLAFIESAWQAIDAAMASLDEIRFDTRMRGKQPQSGLGGVTAVKT